MKRTVLKTSLAWLLAMSVLLTSSLSARADGTDAPPAEPQTDSQLLAETAPEAAQEEETLPLTVSEILALRSLSEEQQAAVSVTGGNSSVRAGSVQESLLLAKRLQKLAANHERNLIIFRGNGFVYVRADASTEAEYVGKMYYNSVASVQSTVYREDGVWLKVSSGSVEGYVRSEFFVSGNDALNLLGSTSLTWALPVADAQRLYKEESVWSDTLTLLRSDQKYRVISVGSQFTKLLFGETEQGASVIGYVPNDAIVFSQDWVYAISLEEENMALERAQQILNESASREASREASRYQSSVNESLAAESRSRAESEAASRAAESAEASRIAASQWLASSALQSSLLESSWLESSRLASSWWEQYLATSTDAWTPPPDTTQPAWSETNPPETTTSTDPPETTPFVDGVTRYAHYIPEGTSALRRAIVLDALQYVDILWYAWGGESLTDGADCSGFLRAIFANHGIDVPHYTYSIAKTGIKVMSLEEARAGDIICFRTDDEAARRGHVGLYIGSHMMVHSPSTGRQVCVIYFDTEEMSTIQNVICD